MKVEFIKDKCVKCGLCETSCAFGAITIDDDGYPAISVEECKLCGACVRACPTEALELIEENIDDIKQIVYYKQGVDK